MDDWIHIRANLFYRNLWLAIMGSILYHLAARKGSLLSYFAYQIKPYCWFESAAVHSIC